MTSLECDNLPATFTNMFWNQSVTLRLWLKMLGVHRWSFFLFAAFSIEVCYPNDLPRMRQPPSNVHKHVLRPLAYVALVIEDARCASVIVYFFLLRHWNVFFLFSRDFDLSCVGPSTSIIICFWRQLVIFLKSTFDIFFCFQRNHLFNFFLTTLARLTLGAVTRFGPFYKRCPWPRSTRKLFTFFFTYSALCISLLERSRSLLFP